MIFLTIIGFLLLLSAVYRSLQLLTTYFKWRTLQAIPGPDCSFWMGQFTAIRREPFMSQQTSWLQNLPDDAPLLRYNNLLGHNFLMILDPAIIKEILTAPAGKNDCRFYKPMFFFPSIVGKGLVTLEGEEWVKHRRLIQPAFAVPFLKQALDASVAPKTENFLQLWLKVGPKQEIDVATHLAALTLDIIGDVGFSHSCDGMKDMATWAEQAVTASENHENEVAAISPELSDPLITSMIALLKQQPLRFIMYVSGFGWLDPLINPKTKRARAALNDSVDGIIANARKFDSKNSNSSTSTSQKKRTRSLLQVLMEAKDDESLSSSTKRSKSRAIGLTDRELRDEVKTFLLAGHETTSTWCYWAIFAMAKYPDVQEKLYDDVMKEAPSTGAISLEQVEQMEYLSAFLIECLRLFPPLGITLRRNRYEECFAGYKVPAGTTLMISMHLLHRNPKYWGPDAEAFQPERWLADKNGGVAGGGIDTKGFTFLPFGAGGHSCIGYRFATIEAKLIMAHMARALRIEIAPSQQNVKHTFTSSITTKTKPSLKVVVKQR